MTEKKKAVLFFLFPAALLFLYLAMPAASVEGVRKGAKIGMEALFPALFPALVFSRIMTTALSNLLRGKGVYYLPVFLGLLCGFPIGAKVLSELYTAGRIDKKSAEKTLLFIGSASPAFLIAYFGKGLLGSFQTGWFFFLIQCTIFSFGFLFLFQTLPKPDTENKSGKRIPLAFSRILTISIKEALHSFLFIFSCVVFFTFFSSFLCRLFGLSGISSAVVSSFLELSGGLAEISLLPRNTALPLSALAIGWNGMSVHFQTLGFLQEAGLGCRFYLIGKIFTSILLLFITAFFQKLL